MTTPKEDEEKKRKNALILKTLAVLLIGFGIALSLKVRAGMSDSEFWSSKVTVATSVTIAPIKTYPINAEFEFPINMVPSDEVKLVINSKKHRLDYRCEDERLTIMTMKNGDPSTTMAIGGNEHVSQVEVRSLQFWIKSDQREPTAKMILKLTPVSVK